MKILFRCIFNAALFLMLIVAMVLLLPGLFGIRPYVVYSGSMEPKIPTGAVVFIKEGAYSPETGDIITFHNEDTAVTHRVVKKEEGTFITKGDANNIEDSPISADKIIGKYKGRIPKLGDFAMFLQTPLGMAVFIGIPVCAFIIYDIIRRQRQAKKGNDETEELKKELERLKAEKAQNDREGQ